MTLQREIGVTRMPRPYIATDVGQLCNASGVDSVVVLTIWHWV